MTGRSKTGPYLYLLRFIGYGASYGPLRCRRSSNRRMTMAAAAGITQSGVTREKLAVRLVVKPRVAVI